MIRRFPRQSGFSLAELLVTALIFGIGLLGLAALQVSTIRSNAGGRNRVTAVALAEGCLGSIQAEGAMSWFNGASGTIFPPGSRIYTNPGTNNGLFGNFDVNGQPVLATDPTRVFRATWVRLAKTSATPAAAIGGVTMNEFAVQVNWTDQVTGANGVAMLPSALTISRIIRY